MTLGYFIQLIGQLKKKIADVSEELKVCKTTSIVIIIMTMLIYNVKFKSRNSIHILELQKKMFKKKYM